MKEEEEEEEEEEDDVIDGDGGVFHERGSTYDNLSVG